MWSKTNSYQDPANYQNVISKLHQEINLRGSLERDALQANKALAQRRHPYNKIKTFWQICPKSWCNWKSPVLPCNPFFKPTPNWEFGEYRTNPEIATCQISFGTTLYLVCTASILFGCLSTARRNDMSRWSSPTKFHRRRLKRTRHYDSMVSARPARRSPPNDNDACRWQT